ncbi:NifU family protein [Cellulophaga fucicola]|uniref:Fe-S cluster biogenesis protein NfuA, 4Fe-4S-binding domain n=1 Tax=Cellulophaga fucicola TaxID=76595 RepID=A0A1K1PDH5_9FLAO|nr:NifU family protein [Cellulophaga fucicola]SFW45628.1 Fe-S cluster biogenesis protein NfuA, 4Fe-4S-binding domain [Cellulophaga fucicola]
MKEHNITIYTTTNPAILKFETNHFITKNNSYEYKNIDDAKNSPLAQQLFYLPFIKTVYISGNFIALERFDIVAWDDVRDEVAQQLVEYLNSGEVIVHEQEDPQSVPATVYAENTPNPAAMRFVANKLIVPTIFEFKNKEEAKESELATELFTHPYVKEVFLDENYVSVTKTEAADWNEITLELREHIQRFLTEGKEIVSANSISKQKEEAPATQLQDENLDDVSKQIIDILEEYIKPAVASDGGNIMFKSYDESTKTVNVVLQGACSGCPSSTFTLKNGIENTLKNLMGDKINEVVALNG